MGEGKTREKMRFFYCLVAWEQRENKMGQIEFSTWAHPFFFSLSPNQGEKIRENGN